MSIKMQKLSNKIIVLCYLFQKKNDAKANYLSTPYEKLEAKLLNEMNVDFYLSKRS